MHNQKLAIILMVLSSMFFALMALMVKFVGSYPVYQMLFFRGIVATVAIGSYCRIRGISLKPQNLRGNLIRSLMGTGGVFTYYYAIGQINLPNAVTLHVMNPFFIILFSGLFLSEKIRPYQIVAFIIAMAGAVLVIRPSSDFQLVGSLSAFVSSAFAGGAYVAIRYLGTYDHPKTIVFFFSVFTSTIGLILMLVLGFVVPPMHDLIILLMIGVFTLIAQTIITIAYRMASASRISIYSFTYILFSMILSAIFLNTGTDLLTFSGAALIIVAALINYRNNLKIELDYN